MTLGDMAAAVLNEYKEPVAGSSAMSLDSVYDALNWTYLDVFNEPTDNTYLREADYTFPTVPDQQTNGAIVAGATSIVLENSDAFPNATRNILLDEKDWATYGVNTVATETLSTVTGVSVDHASGTWVQLGYPLSSISDIDEHEIRSVTVDGIKYDKVTATQWLDVSQNRYRKYTIFKEYMYFPRNTAITEVTVLYNRKITTMTTPATDKPTLIPGKFRPSVLVYGAILKMGIRDDMRTGWEWYEKQHELGKRKFFARGNNEVKSEGPITRPSIYD